MKKIRVRMIKDKKASVDGITEILLRKGEYYEFNPDSAQQLIDRQYCVEDKALAGPKETKAEAEKRAAAKKRREAKKAAKLAGVTLAEK